MTTRKKEKRKKREKERKTIKNLKQYDKLGFSIAHSMDLSPQFSSDIAVERNLRKPTKKSAFRCTS